jgi:hypothetical protein
LFGGLHGHSSIKRRCTFVVKALNRSTRNSSNCRGLASIWELAEEVRLQKCGHDYIVVIRANIETGEDETGGANS